MKYFLSLCFALMLGSTSYGLTVPDDECPTHWDSGSGELVNPACGITHTCTRTDGAATITNAGTPAAVTGSQLVCDNCKGCPYEPPPPMNCIDTLSVSFTEVLSVQINSEVSISGNVGVAELESSFGSAIGAEDGRTVTAEVGCGSGSFPECKRGTYNALMTVYNGVQAKITHQYIWVATPSGGETQACPSHQDNGGSRDSTATGNRGSSSATCSWGGYQPCT